MRHAIAIEHPVQVAKVWAKSKILGVRITDVKQRLVDSCHRNALHSSNMLCEAFLPATLSSYFHQPNISPPFVVPRAVHNLLQHHPGLIDNIVVPTGPV